jgi:hypothetical protein
MFCAMSLLLKFISCYRIYRLMCLLPCKTISALIFVAFIKYGKSTVYTITHSFLVLRTPRYFRPTFREVTRSVLKTNSRSQKLIYFNPYQVLWRLVPLFSFPFWEVPDIAWKIGFGIVGMQEELAIKQNWNKKFVLNFTPLIFVGFWRN